MQLGDIVCYIFLVITITATCVESNEEKSEREDLDHERRITKRDATVLVSGFPYQYPKVDQPPKVIYRRISKQRYGPPEIKSRPPRPKYGLPKPTTKSVKKRRTIKPKHKPRNSYNSNAHSKPSHSKRMVPKRRYPPKRRPRPNTPKNSHQQSYPTSESFGEPPIDHVDDYQPPKKSYGEPPVDSYGAPITYHNDEQSAQSSQQTTFYFGDQEFDYRHEHQTVKHPQDYIRDTSQSFSKTRPHIQKPIYVTPASEIYPDHEDVILDPYRNDVTKKKKIPYKGIQTQFHNDYVKPVNKPWRPKKQVSDEIIVGGQYAEPPARYVPKFQPSAPMYDDGDDESFSPKRVGFVDPLIPTSAFKSPYVNYKNSNLAFSPQNLNDAFSIVDK